MLDVGASGTRDWGIRDERLRQFARPDRKATGPARGSNALPRVARKRSVVRLSPRTIGNGARNRSIAEPIGKWRCVEARGVSEYCRERIEELRDLGYTVGVLGEDGKVVLAFVWTVDGPTTLAIGEQFNPGMLH
jgi:hypothetical protein